MKEKKRKSIVWRLVKWTVITLFSLLILVGIGVGILIHFIFTPQKLTPVVERIANDMLNAKVHFDSIELTFFSTFPNFGLDVRHGEVVTKVFQDSVSIYVSTDSLMSFQRCLMTVDPMAYLSRKDVVIKELLIEKPRIYAFVNEEGVPGWDVMKIANTDSLPEVTPDTSSVKTINSIDIKNVRIKEGVLIFDDRANQLYARMENLGVGIDGAFARRKSRLDVEIQMENLLFWQQGELLVKNVTLGLKSGMSIDRDSLLYTLDRAVMDINGLKFGLGGECRGDSVTRTLDVDMKFGMQVPSLKTVLDLVPPAILKRDKKAEVEGSVLCNGTIKGIYGKDRIPIITSRIRINNGAVRYEGMPYALEKLELDVEGQVDLQRQQPSYVKLSRLYLKGASTEVDLSAEIQDLITAPRLLSNMNAVVDFTSLTQIFPLEEGVSMKGELNSVLKVNILLSDIKSANYGRMDIRGGCRLKDVVLKSERDSFLFRSKSIGLGFGTNMKDDTIWQGKNLLNGIFGFDSVDINMKERLVFHMDTSYVHVKTSPLRDTTAVASMSANIRFGRIRLTVDDTLSLMMGNSKAKLSLGPSPSDKKVPQAKASVEMDSLRIRALGNRLRMEKAGFDLTSVMNKDDKRIWKTSGIIGFRNLGVYTPVFPLRMRMPATKITLAPGRIELNGAKLRIGHSDVLLTGAVYNLADAFLHKGELKAELAVRSKMIDCNQLMKAMEVGEANRSKIWGMNEEEMSEEELEELDLSADSTYVADSTMAVFVVPPGIDFKFETRINKVLYGKLELDSIHGEMIMRNQCIELSDLSLRSMAADMKTTMLYKASTPERAYAGFDLRMDDIHVASLINFMPSLDTLFPMLRSFEGMVDFHIAAEADLDSTMMIDLPTLRAAAYLDGKDLVLLDGETFAEISKMLMFKNKNRNMIDSVSVDFLIKNGVIEIFPFMIEMDRYKVAVGGEHHIDMNFKYHVSLLKSPIPFRAGVDISGSLEKMKFRITKAKYKDIFIPSRRAKVDSTQLNLRKQIRQLLQSVKQAADE